MSIKISCNNITLIKNSGKLSLEQQNGAILEIIGLILYKPKDLKEKNTLGFSFVAKIIEINLETKYKKNDIITTSEDKFPLYRCVYSQNNNYFDCFYFNDEQVFSEGFLEEIFVTDEQLQAFQEISLQDIEEYENVYSLKNINICFEHILSGKIKLAYVKYDLLKKFSVIRFKNENGSENFKPSFPANGDSANNSRKCTIAGVKIERYSIGISKHECLKTDEEFEKNCSEIYDVGNSKFCLPMKDKDLIQSCIYRRKQYWDDGMLSKIDEVLKDKATILDIGSNIGNHSLYWANERNAKKIYAFEPYPYTYKILEKNVKINNLEKRMKIFPFGLSDEEMKGSVSVFCDTNIGGTNFTKNENGDFDFKTLDSLKIKDKIDLIKIDVENAEIEVLNGGIKTITKNRPVIVIETFTKKDKVEEILFPIGYKLHDIKSGSGDYIYCCEDNI